LAFDNTKAIRDQVIGNVHGIDINRISSVTLDFLSARILETMNDVAVGLYALRDWTFRYLEVTPFALLPGVNDVDLPAAWVNEGKQGGVWRLGEPLGRATWRPLHFVTDQLRRYPNESGPPQIYAVSGLRKLRMFPPPDGNMSLAILMLRSMPALVMDPVNPEDDGMTTFPELMRLAVYRGVAGEECRRKGDVAEYPLWIRRYESAVFDLLCSEQQGAPEPGFMPRYAGSADTGSELFD
jgi:hypothetical protein